MPHALQSPFLISEAVTAVARARRLRHPVWLLGGPGTGAYEVSRALHGDGDPRGFVSVRQVLREVGEIDTRLKTALESDLPVDAVTLFVERIERQPPAVQERLLRWSDEGTVFGGQRIPVRLLAQSDEGYRPSDLLPSLRLRLSALTIPLPGLAARRQDVAAIALAIADRVTEEIGLPEAVIDDAMLASLGEREWPGNIDELTSVVTRALIAADGSRVSGLDEPRASQAAPRAAAMETAKAPVSAIEPVLAVPTHPKHEDHGLELIVAEIAHELKNPMVTIKTFAENLDQLLKDPSLRDKFTGLTREAIDRMDGFLEDLLRFSRYAEPKLATLSLTQVLRRAIDANPVRIRERVELRGISGKHIVRGDEEQVTFALKSLMRGLCREIPADASIHVDLSPAGELTFASAGGGGTQQKLHGTLDRHTNGNGPWSLDLMMADALIRRNGGSSRVVREEDEMQVRVTLPSPEREAHVR